MREVRYDFGGEIAVVTGGASGIGAAVSAALAAAGAEVVVWDVAPAPDATAARGIRCDVTSATGVAAARDETLALLGEPTMLVNCAGIVGAPAPALESDPGEWERLLDVNLIGVLRVCQALVPAMAAAGSGRVVNVASMTGIDANAGYGAYSASKAALINLTQAMGKEWAGRGVVVNAVAPGMVDSPFIERMADEYIAGRVAKSALGRLIRPDEVAHAVLWLLSDGSTFLTGYALPLAGGRL